MVSESRGDRQKGKYMTVKINLSLAHNLLQ